MGLKQLTGAPWDVNDLVIRPSSRHGNYTVRRLFSISHKVSVAACLIDWQEAL